MKLPLISNSTNAGEEYLRYPLLRSGICCGCPRNRFAPYAAGSFSYAAYERKVQARFDELGIRARSVHPALKILRGSSGGRGDFLRRRRQHFALTKKMQEQVTAGDSAENQGRNALCRLVRRKQCLLSDACTTNDMPIVQPESFRRSVPKFQINPHYLDANPEGHAGETREQRISNISRPIRAGGWPVCARGVGSVTENGRFELIGKRSMRMFRKRSRSVRSTARR